MTVMTIRSKKIASRVVEGELSNSAKEALDKILEEYNDKKVYVTVEVRAQDVSED